MEKKDIKRAYKELLSGFCFVTANKERKNLIKDLLRSLFDSYYKQIQRTEPIDLCKESEKRKEIKEMVISEIIQDEIFCDVSEWKKYIYYEELNKAIDNTKDLKFIRENKIRNLIDELLLFGIETEK